MRSFQSPLCRLLALSLASAAMLFSGTTIARSPVPFKATIAVTELIHPVGAAPCFLIGDITGQGHATDLGKLTLVSRDCINPIPTPTPEEQAFSFFSNQVVLTAANGDQVFATYTGVLIFEGAVGSINGGYLITGGTGRFSQATGAGTVRGLEDRTGTGQVELKGNILY
jgi:hypothetical protein